VNRARLAVAALSVLAMAAQAFGGEPASAPAARETERLAVQKQALVNRLLYDSPAIRNIDSNGDAGSREHLAAARASHRRAQMLIQAGDAAGAEAALNEAMWLIGKARQRSPDMAARLVELRVRYAQLSASVDSLRGSFEKHNARLPAARRPAGEAVLARANQAVENARSLADSDQLREANQELAEAESVLLAGINQVLGSTTLDYSQRFEAPADEFANELERNRSYAELVPLALAEFRPSQEAVRFVGQHVDGNRELRAQAERHAARRDFASALSTLRAGTQLLQRALTVAGLVMPAEGTRP
jgi:hypothetical protein